MILQALVDYYRRKGSQDPSAIAPPGWELKELPYIVVIDRSGGFVQLDSTEEGEGRDRRAKAFLVPAAQKRGSNIKANLLWDNVEYALGAPRAGATPGHLEKVVARHSAFIARVDDLLARGRDEGLVALRAFLGRYSGGKLGSEADWLRLTGKGPFVSFRLQGDEVPLIVGRAAVRALIESGERPAEDGVCLVTGESDSPLVLHAAIKGVWRAQPTGANLVSFNLDAFRSFGKTQGLNAPVGERAAFAYVTALNHLLRKDSKQKIQVGDATTVFWSEKASGSVVESAFAGWFDLKDDPDEGAARVRALYEFKRGRPLTDDDGQRFFVLGLAPNAARVAIRFWHVATVKAIGERVFKHFADLDIVRAPGTPLLPSMYQLLRSIAVLEKADNIPPNLAGDWMRAVLTGSPYPQTLLQSAVRRCRARQEVGWARAAVVKACLNRSKPDSERDITVALDTENTNTGYRLGRLFAVFEKVQEEANPGLSATIRDRYFGAASASPLVAFPILNRLKMHHLAKLENRGRMVNMERLIGEVMNGLDAQTPFPPHLSLADQGRFAVGYYHQRQKFFEKTGGEK